MQFRIIYFTGLISILYLYVINNFSSGTIKIKTWQEEYFMNYNSSLCTPVRHNTSNICPIMLVPETHISKLNNTSNMCKTREKYCTIKLLDARNNWYCFNKDYLYCQLDNNTLKYNFCSYIFNGFSIPCLTPNIHYYHKKIIHDNNNNYCVKFYNSFFDNNIMYYGNKCNMFIKFLYFFF